MLDALIAGDRGPARLADLARRRLRSKIPELAEALAGRFSSHHAFLARVHLDLTGQHTAAITQITARIEEAMEPFHGFRALICSIPGIATLTADVIVAETGAGMTRFPAAGHLASRAGSTPGSNESDGKVKSSRTRPGNPCLQGALGAAAMACAQNPGTCLGAKYRRIATRRGPQKANVAVQRAMLTGSGTWAPAEPSATTPAPATSPSSTPTGHATVPSASSRPRATTSHSKRPHDTARPTTPGRA